jgi:AraC-like DNA-binding protein
MLEAGAPLIFKAPHRIGFADQNHLARHFKRLLGVSPYTALQYRKNVQELGKNAQAFLNNHPL